MILIMTSIVGRSVADIAEAHGVSHQTIYKYFRVVAEHDSGSLHQKKCWKGSNNNRNSKTR
ncbi:MAG: TetR family transcriptional regulator [Ruminococcus sp.]|nr:TetR family transcriptional regulator [Ruminococcus sp.]